MTAKEMTAWVLHSDISAAQEAERLSKLHKLTGNKKKSKTKVQVEDKLLNTA